MVHTAKKEHIDFFLVYGLSVVFIIILSIVHFTVSRISIKKVEPQKEAHTAGPMFTKSSFIGIKTEGKAYIVYDLVLGEIIASKNENEILPLASLTKIMMAVSATLHKPKEEKIIITPKSIEDGYDLGLKNNQSWSLSELLKYTLIFSSNDGAEAVADSFGGKGIFLTQMNNDAKKYGLNLFFTDPAGRDLLGQIGGKGNALDVAKLFGIARKTMPEILDATTKKRQTVVSSTGKIAGIPNTNQEIENLPGAEASKTGYTDLAGGNLGVIVDISIGHPIVMVVLGATKEGRFRDMNLLYETLRKSLNTH